MFNELASVTPAVEKNRYSSSGDLMKFGDSTLLEWKIVQLLKVIKKEAIYISTPSKKIQGIAKARGVNTIERREGSTIHDMIAVSAKAIDAKHILWTNATSPFIGPKHYTNIINKYFSLANSEYDSIVAVLKMQEYIMYKNAPINFDINITELRNSISPIYKFTTGCSITQKETSLKYIREWGVRPFLYEVDKFASMEISEIDDDAIFNDLVAHYFRKDLDIVYKDR